MGEKRRRYFNLSSDAWVHLKALSGLFQCTMVETIEKLLREEKDRRFEELMVHLMPESSDFKYPKNSLQSVRLLRDKEGEDDG